MAQSWAACSVSAGEWLWKQKKREIERKGEGGEREEIRDGREGGRRRRGEEKKEEKGEKTDKAGRVWKREEKRVHEE